MTRRNEEHVDPRAHKHFRHCYGPDGYQWEWSSTSEARPTKIIQISRGTIPICAYCGRKSLPIQGVIKHGWGSEDYHDLGRCCVCKDAMDELEVKDTIKAMKREYEERLEQLEDTLPKVNPKVISDALERQHEAHKKELLRSAIFGVESLCEDFGFKVIE